MEMVDASASFDDGEPLEPKHVVVLASNGPSGLLTLRLPSHFLRCLLRILHSL